MDFESFPKIPRLNRDIVITEKIDGTNAAVLIEEIEGHLVLDAEDLDLRGWLTIDGRHYAVQAQSRKRLITPESDNFGFARWVRENAEELVRLMGPGRHFGEWWGQGIQRGYGLARKRFSLFNPTFRWGLEIPDSPLRNLVTVDTVPVLYEGPFDQGAIGRAVDRLSWYGSEAAPGFMNPEGVIVYHTAAGSLFKVTCQNDEKPKGSNE